MNNKTILENANNAISNGDHETFLSYCTENTTWIFVGDRTLSGKNEVRQYIKETYSKPPIFDVDYMIGENDYVTVVGTIRLWEDSEWIEYDYCDVWRFEDGKMAEVKAFVIKK